MPATTIAAILLPAGGICLTATAFYAFRLLNEKAANLRTDAGLMEDHEKQPTKIPGVCFVPKEVTEEIAQKIRKADRLRILSLLLLAVSLPVILAIQVAGGVCVWIVVQAWTGTQ